MLSHLKAHLSGKVIILGIGNTLRSDDGAGSILANRIKDKVSFKVFDSGPTPENYLEKIIKENPDNILILDAADFGGSPGEYRVIEADELRTVNFFSTHNASITLTINYLKSSIKADIIILIIQPKTIVFSDILSEEVSKTLDFLEGWLDAADKKEG
ncbi:MAG: hydrogenase maturation protease [bacterium]